MMTNLGPWLVFRISAEQARRARHLVNSLRRIAVARLTRPLNEKVIDPVQFH